MGEAKCGIDSLFYQIVVQAPDFVINGSLVIKDALYFSSTAEEDWYFVSPYKH